MSEKRDTETLDRLYLEWSQFTTAKTFRDIALDRIISNCEEVLRLPPPHRMRNDECTCWWCMLSSAVEMAKREVERRRR